MKVLYVVTAFDRHESDVITPWLGETIRRLRRVGVEVDVLAPSYRGLGDQLVEGIRVHRFRYAPSAVEDMTHDETAPDRIRRRPWYLALVPGYVAAGMAAAARLVRREPFDLVHVHWPIPHAPIGFAARAAAGIPVVCSFHGVELTWTRRQLPFLRPLLRRIIRTADAVTANSSYTARLIREVHDRPVVRIPFGSTADPLPDDTASATREDSDAFELLFVGRLVERKGVHYLLDALARLRDARVRLRVIGDGPMRAELEARARRNGVADAVVFEGFVSRERLARALGACDAFVLPAIVDTKGDTEGLGVVLIEALQHGKPVIASDAGGIPDVIRDGETGLLVPPADAPALAAAIARLAADAELRNRLGTRGRQHVEAEFGWPAIIERLVGLYRSLVPTTSS